MEELESEGELSLRRKIEIDLWRFWRWLDMIPRRIHWAWQRLTRGWDDTVIWGIDTYLSEVMPVWLEKLRDNKQGIPSEMFNDEDFDESDNYNATDEGRARAEARWNEILDIMILGFRSANRLIMYDWDTKAEQRQLYRQWRAGARLFAKHYFSLWD